MIASPKVDGIRVLIHPELGPVTRKLKAVPNRHIQKALNYPSMFYLDGEIVRGGAEQLAIGNLFNDTQSCVMSYEGTPHFTFWVFDNFESPNDSYVNRLSRAEKIVTWNNKPHIKLLESIVVTTPEGVLKVENHYLDLGFEGIMLRSPNGAYKFNRATLKQQQLIKLKRTEDAEAVVTGYTPLQRNQNAPTRDALGYQVRSSEKAGKLATDLLGTLVVSPTPDSGFSLPFEIGSGFDDNLRSNLWNTRDSLIGKTVTFKFQRHGSKDRPRHPIFKGFRED